MQPQRPHTGLQLGTKRNLGRTRAVEISPHTFGKNEFFISYWCDCNISQKLLRSNLKFLTMRDLTSWDIYTLQSFFSVAVLKIIKFYSLLIYSGVQKSLPSVFHLF